MPQRDLLRLKVYAMVADEVSLTPSTSESMGLRFAATLPSQQDAMLQFLRDVFRAPAQSNSFQPAVLEWKYFRPHPNWSQPRSFLLQKADEILAHGGVWPIRLATAGEEAQAIHLVDWAGSPSSLGAGVHVLRNLAALADLMITIGGSQDTKKILPKLGYKNAGVLKRYVRVVRPWLQLRTRPAHDWKSPLRFLRNASATIKPLAGVPAAWRIERRSSFGAEIDAVLGTAGSPPEIRPRRSAAALNYMLNCPAADFSAYIVDADQVVIGYFMLARIGRQARIVDIGASSGDSKLWGSLCMAAARTAAEDEGVAEIVAGTSSQQIGRVWEELGFRLCRQDTILVQDRRKLLPEGALLNLHLIDGDVSFLYDPQHPYMS
ncbi:MAG TPA: hypothetical protein VF133_03495 [Terriglobales bacterium]